MQIETYEATEQYDGEIENRSDAFDLVAELGLEGQAGFFENDKPAFPYRKMTAEESRVYGLLFKEKTEITKYSDDPIPLRVLQVAAHANQYFERLMVWHAPNADIKDPVLIGENGNSYSSTCERFILARWGDSLLPFPSLRELAGKVRRAQIQKSCVEGISKAKAHLESIEQMDDNAIMLADIKEFSCYIH